MSQFFKLLKKGIILKMQENTLSLISQSTIMTQNTFKTNTELIRMRHQSIKFRRTESHPLIADGGKERKDRQTDRQTDRQMVKTKQTVNRKEGLYKVLSNLQNSPFQKITIQQHTA